MLNHDEVFINYIIEKFIQNSLDQINVFFRQEKFLNINIILVLC